jgi:hypothetical protein
MRTMERPTIQFSLTALLGLVACAAMNVWLFRVSVLAGIIGLNVTKHVLIAVLCQFLGVDRRSNRQLTSPAAGRTPHAPPP